MAKKNEPPHPETLGLIPAGGSASRIAPIPCSKELFPIGFRKADENQAACPKVVSHYLLEKMRTAGITKAYLILRKGKWDIPAYFGDGKILNMHLAYLMMDLPFGVPYTIDQAYPFVQEKMVAFGFPDIIFQPDDAFVRLRTRQAESNADVVLGLFPTHQPQNADMVDLDADGRVREIQIKPARTHLRYAWIIAFWNSVFTHFMHEYIMRIRNVNAQHENSGRLGTPNELFIGDVLQAAIDNQLRIKTVTFPNHTYLDIGTAENLLEAFRDGTSKLL